MFKNIILAVLIAMVLTYSLSHLVNQWLDLHISFAQHDVELITSIIALTGVVAILVVVGFIIACSLFAAIVFALITAGIGLFVVGLSVFWPIIFFTLVIFLLVRDKQTAVH